jgi:hypothetical protein
MVGRQSAHCSGSAIVMWNMGSVVAAFSNEGGGAPIAGDEVSAVLQLEEGKGKVKVRDTGERQEEGWGGAHRGGRIDRGAPSGSRRGGGAPISRADERQGGGGGCARRAPCEEKGGAGEKFWPGGGRCHFNGGAVWSSGLGGMGVAPCDGAWSGDPGSAGSKQFKPFSNLNGLKTFKFFQNLIDSKGTFPSSKNLKQNTVLKILKR